MSAASKQDIRRWLGEAQSKEGCTHLIVVCDTFSFDDYPVYVSGNEDVCEIHAKFDGKDMQKVIEVYNLSFDIEKQLGEHRAIHF